MHLQRAALSILGVVAVARGLRLEETHAYERCLVDLSCSAFVLQPSSLVGRMPTELGMFTRLTAFSISHGSMSSMLPTELGLLTALDHLRASTLGLQHTLPTELGQLTNLQSLVLNENQLSGELPSQLLRLTKLVELAMHVNKLSGPLPSAIGDLRALERMDFTGNSLSGVLPSTLGDLSNLLSIELASNLFWGPLSPDILSKWTRLEALALRGNQFSGAVPSEIGLLKNLVLLLLESNALAGELPTEMLLLPSDAYCILQAFPSDETEWNDLRATNVPQILDICELAPANASDIAIRRSRSAAPSPVGVDIGLTLASAASELDGDALDEVLRRTAQLLGCPRSWLSIASVAKGSKQLTIHVSTPTEGARARLAVADTLGRASLDELSAALGVELVSAPRVQNTQSATQTLQEPHGGVCATCMRHRCGGACGRAMRIWSEPVNEPERHKCMCTCCSEQCNLGRFAKSCHHSSITAAPVALARDDEPLELGAREERAARPSAALAAAACGAVVGVALLARYQLRTQMRTGRTGAQAEGALMN